MPQLKMSKHPPYTLSVIVCQRSDLNTFSAVIATSSTASGGSDRIFHLLSEDLAGSTRAL